MAVTAGVPQGGGAGPDRPARRPREAVVRRALARLAVLLPLVVLGVVGVPPASGADCGTTAAAVCD